MQKFIYDYIIALSRTIHKTKLQMLICIHIGLHVCMIVLIVYKYT